MNTGIRCKRHPACPDRECPERGGLLWHALSRRSERRVVLRTLAPLAVMGLVGQLGLTPLMAQPSPLDTTSLGQSDYSTMSALLEKTIFQVDVLTLDLRFGPETAGRLRDLVAGRAYSSPLADSVAAVALDARDVWARLRFKRDVGLNQFLGGVRDNLKHAREAGIIDSTTYEMVSEALPRWYGFLSARGIHKGDEMLYRIRGDTLRTVYRTVEGEISLDQVDVGPERRLSVTGGYFAPKSDFRKNLIKSLFEGWPAGNS